MACCPNVITLLNMDTYILSLGISPRACTQICALRLPHYFGYLYHINKLNETFYLFICTMVVIVWNDNQSFVINLGLRQYALVKQKSIREDNLIAHFNVVKVVNTTSYYNEIGPCAPNIISILGLILNIL